MRNQAFVYANCNKLFVYTVMTFGEWLREEIKRTGLSNAEIGRRSGFSPTYIGNLVRDHNPNTKDGKGRPSEEAVTLIAKATGGNLDDAREAAGYSRLSTPSKKKPTNVREFFEALETLGLDVRYDGGMDMLEKLGEDELQELLDSAVANASAKVKRIYQRM